MNLDRLRKDFETILGYSFHNTSLLLEALRHKSAATNTLRSYERLEFLGDRVLGLCVSRLLFENYKNKNEGFLSASLGKLVCAETLAEIAREWKIPLHMVCGASDRQAGLCDNPSVLADICEALLGAVYLDADLNIVYDIVKRFWWDRIINIHAQAENPKTALQEWTMSRKMALPLYTVLSQEGPHHAPLFVVEVSLQDGKKIKAEGRSKQDASVKAARKLLDQLKGE